MRKRRTGAFGLSIVMSIVALVAPATPVVQIALAACPNAQKYDLARDTPGDPADGVRAEWILRTLDATDWADGGHTNTTVWMGTNGDPDAWVEVGVTDGFEGQNAYKFYSAHQYVSGGTPIYDAVTMAKTPVLGRVVQFTVRETATSFRGEVTDTAGTQGIGWSHHALPVADYDIGLEYTCGDTSRADKHFVVTNQYRRDSDGVWLNATFANGASGYLVFQSPGGVAWCQEPRTLRFYLNSQIPIGTCT